MAIPALILAAGASRRLGQPKQLVQINGESLLDRTIRVAREAGADPIVAVLGANLDLILKFAKCDGTRIVKNILWEQGIASSIHSGIQEIQQVSPTATGILLLVCDQPNVTSSHLANLTGEFANTVQPAIVASTYSGIVGIPAIFPSSQFPNLLGLSGDAGARYLLRNPSCPLVLVSFPGGEIDVDTPADLSILISVHAGS